MEKKLAESARWKNKTKSHNKHSFQKSILYFYFYDVPIPPNGRGCGAFASRRSSLQSLSSISHHLDLPQIATDELNYIIIHLSQF